jgi:signal transduction histidine kinase
MTSRILIVEDSRTQAERLRLLLLREGYEVRVALNGRQGLASADPDRTDLIISDITMPEMDGYAFCRAVKSSEATRRIPFILLTARSSPADIITGLECGADNFIPKPYEDAGLLQRVRRIFEQLEHRKRGVLDMEVHLTLGGRRISVTADRQQIMELLFSTFEDVSRNHDALARANRQLEQARAQAERANRAKSEFLSRMSHELRTPLNAIMGFGQLLEMASLGPREQDSAHRIVTAGRHLLNLINDVLDVGRIEAGEFAFSAEPVRVGDVLNEAVGLLRPLAAERGVEVSGQDTCHLHVRADRHRLRQVLLNLLSNAIKYNRPQGTVSVACWEASEGRLRIEVADTGVGIARENLDRLFVPFDRIGAERDPAVEGTGLGLVLSRRLIEAMGGTLGVDTRAGCGSTFWIELPAAERPIPELGTEPAPAPHLARPPEGSRRPMTLLCIEDDHSNLALVERILVHRPETTLLAVREGLPGLDLARRHRPDVILLDLNLPDISGEKVLVQLRATPETRRIPTIVVTADASVAQLRRLQAMQVSGYLTKPFSVPRFLELVEETLAATGHPVDCRSPLGGDVRSHATIRVDRGKINEAPPLIE